jgi:hypothetical protein
VVGLLGPGSPAPRNPEEVEALLRAVPRLAFAPELEALLPAPLGPGPLSPQAVTEGLATADPAWLSRMVAALSALEERALVHADGGLRFLAVTLRHFLDEQRIDPAEHPLVVALFVRTAARRGQWPDHPGQVARVLDGW